MTGGKKIIEGLHEDVNEIVTVLDGDVLDIDWRGWTGPGTVAGYISLKCLECRHQNDPELYDLTDNRPKVVACQACGAHLEVLKSVDVTFTSRIPRP
jgi:hypothetical protein